MMVGGQNGLSQEQIRFRLANGIPGLGEGAIAAGGSNYAMFRNFALWMPHGSEPAEINVRITVRCAALNAPRLINAYYQIVRLGVWTVMGLNPTAAIYAIPTTRYPPFTDITQHADRIQSLTWTGTADNNAAAGGGAFPLTTTMDGTPTTELDHEITFRPNWSLILPDDEVLIRLRHNVVEFRQGYRNTAQIFFSPLPPGRSFDVITADPSISVLTRDPTMAVVSETPRMDVLTRDPTMAVVSEAPSKDVLTRDPVVSITLPDPRMDVLTRDPLVAIVSEDPRMDVLTRDPVVSIVLPDPRVEIVN